jgi:hypothetical protein
MTILLLFIAMTVVVGGGILLLTLVVETYVAWIDARRKRENRAEYGRAILRGDYDTSNRIERSGDW